jgi:hypothetical protein
VVIASRPLPGDDATLGPSGGLRAARAALAPVDFGDGPRVPLSRIGGRFGVVVVITEDNINVVRRDGTALRLKGVTPGDPAVTEEDRRLFIYEGEAWAYPSEIPDLLGVSQDWQVAEAGLLASEAALEGRSFETFEVAKPSVSRPAAPAPPSTPSERPAPRSETSGPADTVMTYVAPVEVDLSIGRTLTFADLGINGFWHEVIGPASLLPRDRSRWLRHDSSIGRTLSSLSLEARQGGDLCTVGDVYDPLFGSATGIEMESATSNRERLAAAVLVPTARPGETPRGQLAIRARRPLSKSLTAEAALAADGSYLVSGSLKHAGLDLHSSLAEYDDARRLDLWCQQKLTPRVSLFGRASEVTGVRDAEASLLGARWSLGSAQVGIERGGGSSAGETWGTDAISFSLLTGRRTAVLRWVTPRQGRGPQGIEGSVSQTDPSGRQFFLSTSAPDSGYFGGRRTYRAGASLPLRRDLRVKVALDWGGGGAYPEGKIEWRPARDRVIALRYGILDPDSTDFTATPDRAWVLQASWAFGGSDDVRPSTGGILGHVKDDSGQPAADITIVLDDSEKTLTGEDGSYEFEGLEIGRHSVRIDPSLLHAHLGGGGGTRTVFVTEHELERVDFMVMRLCRISGHVKARSRSSEYEEPLPGVAVALNPDRRTSTDSQGRYSFAGLQPGQYTVALMSADKLAGASPVPPTSWSFNLRPGDEVSHADFRFEREERPVLFDALDVAQ